MKPAIIVTAEGFVTYTPKATGLWYLTESQYFKLDMAFTDETFGTRVYLERPKWHYQEHVDRILRGET